MTLEDLLNVIEADNIIIIDWTNSNKVIWVGDPANFNEYEIEDYLDWLDLDVERVGYDYNGILIYVSDFRDNL